MSRYLVTGCAGFIASHLSESLLSRGHEVVGVDSFTDYYPRTTKEANLEAARRSERFALIDADLADLDLERVSSGVAGIFHLAAQAGVRGSWGESFSVYAHDNIVATQRLFEAAARTGVRVVFASSSSVYGDAETYPTREDTELRPISPYGVTKATCEQLARAYGKEASLDIVSLRYFTVYGPRQRPDMAFARIARSIAEGQPFTIYGNGEQTRDFTFVGDAVNATAAAMEAGRPNTVYNVGGGAEASLLEAIRTCERLAGRRVDLRSEQAARGDVARTAADTSRLRLDVGWLPRTSLEDGLAQQLAAAGCLGGEALPEGDSAS